LIPIILSNSGLGGANLALLEFLEVIINPSRFIVILPEKNDSLAEKFEKIGVNTFVISLKSLCGSSEYKIIKKLAFLVLTIKHAILLRTILFMQRSNYKSQKLIISNSSTIFIGYVFSIIFPKYRHIVFHRESIELINGKVQLSQYEGIFKVNIYAVKRFLNKTSFIYISDYVKESVEKVLIGKGFNSLDVKRYGTKIFDGVQNCFGDFETNQATTQKREFRFGVVGLYMPNKGQLEVIDAINIVNQVHNLDYQVLFIGNVASLKKYIKESNVKNIQLINFIERDKIFQMFDVLIMPSKNEALGRVTVEAMYSKKLILGLKSGATTELIGDSERGRIYTNTQELVKNMVDLIELGITKKDEYNINKAFEFSDIFNIKKYVEEINKKFENIAAESPYDI
jgi:glycosyltransferase involved in cell wall biosynthesis